MSEAGRRVGKEQRIEVPRTARYLTLGPADATDLWIVLHGYGQLAGRFLRRFAPIDDETRRIVAPEALSRFYVGNEPGRHGPESMVGATWMTREAREDEIHDYVRYLDLVAERVLQEAEGEGTDDVRLTVLGFSQGVATAARWTTMGQVAPGRVVLWADFLPPDLDIDAARRRWEGVDVVLVRGDDDRALGNQQLADEERERLGRLGGAVRTMRYAGGHDIEPEPLLELARG